jgi:serine/threonine protein kinase
LDEGKKKFALKRLREENVSNMKAIMTEIDVLKSLNHPNIVRVSSLKEGTLKTTDGSTKTKIPYALMELAPNGEILHYLMATGPFPVPIARHYFKCLMYGLKYCHDKGVAHRDIKPDNLLLGEKFELKLADFGFAALFREKNKGGKLYTNLGTDAYMAPEIRTHAGYSGPAVDLFAAGIMVFIMVTGRPPFNKATVDDKYYIPFCTGKTQKFWDMHNPKKVDNEAFSKDFVDLINGMLAYDPNKRFSTEKVFSHAWMKGKEASAEEVFKYMNEKKEVVDKNLMRSKQQAALKKKSKPKVPKPGFRSRFEDALSKTEEIQHFQKVASSGLDLSKPRELPQLRVL